MMKDLRVSDADAGVIIASMADDARSRFLLAAAANVDGLDFAKGIVNRGAQHADGSVVPHMPDIKALLPAATVTVFFTADDDLVASFFGFVAADTGKKLGAVRDSLVVGAPGAKGVRVLQPVGAGSNANVFCLSKKLDGDGAWDGGVTPAAAGGASLFSEDDCTRVLTCQAVPEPLRALLRKSVAVETDFREKITGIEECDSNKAGAGACFHVAGGEPVSFTPSIGRGQSGAAASPFFARSAAATLRIGFAHLTGTVGGFNGHCELALFGLLWAPFAALHPQQSADDEGGGTACKVGITRNLRPAQISDASNDFQELRAAEVGLEAYEVQKLGGIKEVRKVLEGGAELDDLRKRAADAMSAMGAYSGCGRRLAAAA